MKHNALVSGALGALAAASIVSGCAGLQAAAQTLPAGRQAARQRASWMSPNAGGMNLLYVSEDSSVIVYDYGTSTQVGQLDYFSHAAGSCTDSAGDVYVTNYGAADVIEFAHGKSSPIKTLVDPSPYATDCSVDPTTGNLAVINQYGQAQYAPGNVAIYPAGKNSPKTYKIKGFVTYISGTYDATGNLLVSDDESSGPKFAILQHGTSSFKAVSLPHDSQWTRPGYVRWDGEYFDVEYVIPFYNVPCIFLWYTVNGTRGTQEGYMVTQELQTNGGPFWLGRVGGPKSVTRANQLVAAISSNYGGVLGWSYPRGGSFIFDVYRYGGGGVTASLVRQ
jgi:hypothetical protein